MAVLTWDQTGEKLYETGVQKGVLYPMAPYMARVLHGTVLQPLTKHLPAQNPQSFMQMISSTSTFVPLRNLVQQSRHTPALKSLMPATALQRSQTV